MIIDHADRLHKCVTDGCADEYESSVFQIFAHGIRLGCIGRYLGHFFPAILKGSSIDKLPDIGVK